MKHQQQLISYIIGFVVSLILTFLSYVIVVIHISSEHETIPHYVLIPSILVIAMCQMLIQLFFFLHVGQQKAAKWNLLFFITTFAAILAIVVGSLWIMSHLNYNMTPMQMTNYINNQSGF